MMCLPATKKTDLVSWYLSNRDMIFFDVGPGIAVTTLGLVGSSGKKAKVAASLTGEATLARYRTRCVFVIMGDQRGTMAFLRKIAGIIIMDQRVGG